MGSFDIPRNYDQRSDSSKRDWIAVNAITLVYAKVRVNKTVIVPHILVLASLLLSPFDYPAVTVHLLDK